MIELTWTITRKRIIGYSIAFLILLVVVPSSLFIWHYEYYHYPPVDFKSSPLERSPLVGTINSYQSGKEFESYLNSENLKWEITEDGPLVKKKVKKEAPKAHMRTYQVFGFTDGISEGRLVVKFFNDRLMFLWFYGSKREEYVKGKYPDYKGNLENPYLIDGTSTRFYHDRGQGLLSWQDRRLFNEYMLWIKRFYNGRYFYE